MQVVVISDVVDPESGEVILSTGHYDDADPRVSRCLRLEEAGDENIKSTFVRFNGRLTLMVKG